MPLEDRYSSKSSGIEIISLGVPEIPICKVDTTIKDYYNAWETQAKSEDLLFILKNAPFGIVVNKGERGEVVYANDEMARIIGYPVAEVGDGKDALKVLAPDHVDPQEKMEAVRLIMEAGGGIYLDEIKCKDGSIKLVEVRVIAMPDMTRVAMWTDVTRRETAEKALREINVDLENRVEKRTDELKKINIKLNQEIHERKKVEKELERSREELRHLSEYLQRTREEERLSLSREVHDELIQPLSITKMDISFLGQNVPKHQNQLKSQIESVEKQIDGSILAVRNICSRLRPAVLMHFGLSAAIEWYLEDLQKRTGIICISQIDVNVPLEETELTLVMFRILQETMTNIIRHSEATEVNVSLAANDVDIVMKVTDNGIGITEEQMKQPQSFGIIGIRERVRFWGGESSFEGVSGKGTTVTISIPLKRQLEPQSRSPKLGYQEKRKTAVIKILVVDELIIFREGIKRVLSTASDIMVSGEAGNGNEALVSINEEQYDVVLLELALPDIEGIELLRRIKKQKPDLPVLILSSFPEDQFALRVLKEGASGYLTKESVPNDLIYAIRKAAAGGKYISASLAERTLAESATGGKKKLPHEMLSEREFEIFCKIAEGKSVKEIVYELSLSRTSVNTYRSRILQKLKFKNNMDILRYAVENRLV